MPVMTEPLICPWWPMGLRRVAVSWAVVKLRSLTSPVSGSTETSAHWAAKQVVWTRAVSLTWARALTVSPPRGGEAGELPSPRLWIDRDLGALGGEAGRVDAGRLVDVGARLHRLAAAGEQVLPTDRPLKVGAAGLVAPQRQR